MKPRSNHAEEPATDVIACATHPPVQDSAVTTVALRALSRSPTRLASSSMEKEPVRERENEKRVARRHEIVQHDAEPAVEAALDPADGRRLHDVEGAEGDEARELPAELVRQHGYDENEGNDLVPDHRAVVVDAEVTRRDPAGPYAEHEGDRKSVVAGMR